jgi:hypothetical protein
MDFVAFPLTFGARGWIARSADRVRCVAQLVKMMLATSQSGWRGSTQFGMREVFAQIGGKQLVPLAAIQQMNQVFEDLGIDWVRVAEIEAIPQEEKGIFSYRMKIVCADDKSDVQQIDF